MSSTGEEEPSRVRFEEYLRIVSCMSLASIGLDSVKHGNIDDPDQEVRMRVLCGFM